MTVYEEVMSIMKINLFSLEKVKSRKIFSAWLVSLMWDGKDLTMGTMVLAGDKFSWGTACRKNGSAGIVRFVDFRFEVDS